MNLKLGNGPKSKEIHNTNIELALELLRAKNTIEARKSCVIASNKLEQNVPIQKSKTTKNTWTPELQPSRNRVETE